MYIEEAEAHEIELPGLDTDGTSSGDSHVESDAGRAAGDREKRDPGASIYHLLTLEELSGLLKTHINCDEPKASSGLSEAEASKRLQDIGPNELTPPATKSEWLKWLSQFADPFMGLLSAAGLLSLGVYLFSSNSNTDLYSASVLLLVVVLSATFGYFQQRKTEAVMAGFQNMLPQVCLVVRDGHTREIPAREVVVGDLVLLGTGKQVPADCRIIWVSDLKIELSSLTGESEPIAATVYTDKQEANEATNMAFSSSLCMEGEAVAVVVATGDRTVFGNIASLASDTVQVETTLSREIKRVVKTVSVLALTMAVTFFTIGMARGLPFITTFVNGFIVVIVANVPQGLPMTVMTALTVSAQKLAKVNVFVKNLQCVETLGSATVVASDKTGTLTQNIMTLKSLFVGGMDVSANSVRRMNAFGGRTNKVLDALKLVMAVNSRVVVRHEDNADGLMRQHSDGDVAVRKHTAVSAAFKHAAARSKSENTNQTKLLLQERQQRQSNRANTIVTGDASERAIFEFVDSLCDVVEVRREWHKVFEIPFNSKWKYSMCAVQSANATVSEPSGEESKFTAQSLRDNPEDDSTSLKVLLKGAPEVVLSMCSSCMLGGESRPLNAENLGEIHAANARFAGLGQRVLAFATRTIANFDPKTTSEMNMQHPLFPRDGFTFLGLASLEDPPKDGVKDAVLTLRAAGVRVMMVTGDHALTAAAIARSVGIFGEGLTREELAAEQKIDPSEVMEENIQSVVVTGTQLASFTEADWDSALSKREVVFARTTPQQKLEIVKALQKRKEVVAVTGDGVNDAPALKRADIGLAMASGSDVAVEASDVVMMDSSFNSIVTGVREGRILYDNLTKTIAYTLTHLFPEILPVLVNLTLSLPLFMGPLLILCVDLGTELFPAISLSYESGEADVLLRPPRNVETDRLVTGRLLFYAYSNVGLLESCFCFASALFAFDYYGIPMSALVGLGDSYFNSSPDGPVLIEGRLFSEDEQQDILASVQTLYFCILVISQACHIWATRTRTTSLFSHPFTNAVLIYGVAIELLLMILISQTPGIQSVFSSASFFKEAWCFALLPLLLIPYTELIKYAARRDEQSFAAKYLVY